MSYKVLFDLLINLFQLIISILPIKKKDTLQKVLHSKFCVNNFKTVFYDTKLIEVMGGNSSAGGAISDHLCTIFADVIMKRPSLIVELGTRGGESTKVLLTAASYSKATVLSIDLSKKPKLKLPPKISKRWEFVQFDDVDFGKNYFINWCETNAIDPQIDFLFIDSSHLYDHTKQEIDTWFKFLADDGVVVFHDTNMAEEYRKLNNSFGSGWNNDRGVIKAIEDYFGKCFDEQTVFVDVENNWLIRHYPYSSGLLLLKRIAK